MASCQRTCERGKGAYLTEPKQTGTELGPGRRSLAMVPREPRQRFRNLSKLVLARAVVRASVEHDLTGRAAQLSFYFLLAIFPLLIFISAMLGYVFASRPDLYASMLGYVGQVMPWQARELVGGTVSDIVVETTGGKLSAGLVLALWSGSSGIVAIIEGLNIAYGVVDERSWWRRKIVAIILTICVGVLAPIATALIFAGETLERLVASVVSGSSVIGPGSTFTGWAISVLSMLLALVLIYRFGPHQKHSAGTVLPGAVVALIGWLLLSLGFRIYLEVFSSFSRTYGSLAAVVVLLLWLYLGACSILIGGEVNAAIERSGESQVQHRTRADKTRSQ